jgi:hypothetical protein
MANRHFAMQREPQRISGHRMGNAPLSEYQMSHWPLLAIYATVAGSSCQFLSLSSRISLAAMIAQVR